MKGPEDGVVDRVVETISRYSMFPSCRPRRGGCVRRCGFAVPAGVLLELRGHWNLRLTVFHLNHLLRGAESDQDETFVRTLAERWGFPVSSNAATSRTLRQLEGENLEQAARKARRQFFRAK